MAFVPRQLLVDRRNTEAIDELVGRYGAEVVEEAPLPAPPDGMAPREGVNLDDRPTFAAVRFRELPEVSERGGYIVREGLGERATVTSPDAARLLSLAAEALEDGLQVELDQVGSPDALPFLAATDSSPKETFGIPSLSGRARVTHAWQLVEAFRAVKPLKPFVTVAVLDAGFWLAGRTPMVANKQTASDLGTSVMQLNLLDESVGAGGASGNKCAGSYSCPWHGNQVAGVATAKVNNSQGTAGTGGTVALPVLFKTDISKSQTYRCLAVCLAWGVDVLNISWQMSGGNFFWGDGSWVDSFRFATNNGLIVVCSAGNNNENIPDESSARPATRTPGTITVGALDTNDIAAGFSNHGSSVDIWAPGVRIGTIPDGGAASGLLVDGTSVAAPFVAGVVAMMRAVNPALSSEQAKQILRRTAWAGRPGNRATHGLDAYAAVLEAMGGRLPDDMTEPNQTAEAARPMQPRGGPGQLGTEGQPLLVSSGAGDIDWHSFTVTTFSAVDISAAYYPLLGPIQLTLLPDDPESRATTELTTAHQPGLQRLWGNVAPGGYRLRVGGSLNLYELTVNLTAAPLALDEFESNDDFDDSSRFTLVKSSREGIFDPLPSVFERRAGSYDLTIHSPANDDFFRIRTGPDAIFTRPLLRVEMTDAAVDVVLYDAAREELQRQSAVRHTELVLPVAAVTYVKISSNQPTRYRLTIREEVDPRKVPDPFQEEQVFHVPDVGDPPFRLNQRVNYLAFRVDAEQSSPIRLASVHGPPLSAEILNGAGEVVARARQSPETPHDPLHLDTAALDSGTYVVRLSALEVDGAEVAAELQVEAVPMWG